MDNNVPDDSLNNNEDEELRMENELLRLKLTAQFGADSQSSGNLDPSIENEFLKHIFEFENNYANSKRVKVFDIIGKPDFKAASELDDESISSALAEVTDLLLKNNIAVDFSGTYDDRTKYAFIVEELFGQETDDMKIPGMVTNFIYEEFHPNHALDIENRAEEFLSGWFKQSIDEQDWFLDNTFIAPDRKTYSKKQVADKLKLIFDSYKEFKNDKYAIRDIGFQFNEGSGIGHAEGYTKYIAVLGNNEEVIIQEPFKLYMSSDCGWWSIFHIVFPGFEY